MKKIFFLTGMLFYACFCYGSLTCNNNLGFTCCSDWELSMSESNALGCTCNYCGVKVGYFEQHLHCCKGMCDNMGFLPSVQHCCGASGSSGTSGSSGKANFGSDTTNQDFFTPNQITELQDWAKNNSQKWDAFEARALQMGYPNFDALLRAASGGMSFNDFAIREIMKYINDNDTKLVRDDSKIPNATFYKGYDKNKSPAKNEEPTPAAGKTPNPNPLVVNDTGGVDIGNGTTPMLLRDKDAELTDEEAALLRINSIVDTGRLITGNTPEQLQVMQEQTSEEQKISDERSKAFAEGVGIVVDPGKEYYTEQVGKELMKGYGIGEEAGETGWKIFGAVVAANGMVQDLKQDNKLGFLGDLKDFVVANLPGELGNAVGTATITTGAYLYAVKQIGIKTVDVFNNALISLNPNGSGLTGGLSAAESLAKTLKDGFNETFENAGMQLKYLKEGKDTEGNFKP